MTNRLDLNSPAGRIVAGNVAKANPLDMNGKPRNKPQYFFALAIAKTDPQIDGLLQQIFQFALQSYSQHPDVVRRINLGLQPGSQFAWKIDDGDSPRLRDRPGYAGCWIIKFSTTIAPRTVNRENVMIDPEQVKTGYYADVAFSVAPNGKTDHTSGLYVNPAFVRLLGYGEEIVAGPTAEQRFGAAPAPVIGSQIPAPAQPFATAPAPDQAPAGFPVAGNSPTPATAPGNPPAPSLPGFGAPASDQAVPAGATAIPAPSTDAAPASTIASPSSVPGFAHGGQRPTSDYDSAMAFYEGRQKS